MGTFRGVVEILDCLRAGKEICRHSWTPNIMTSPGWWGLCLFNLCPSSTEFPQIREAMRIIQSVLDAVYACFGLSDSGLGEYELAHLSPTSVRELEVSTLTGCAAFFNRKLGIPAATHGRTYLKGNATNPTQFRSILLHFSTAHGSSPHDLALRGHTIAWHVGITWKMVEDGHNSPKTCKESCPSAEAPRKLLGGLQILTSWYAKELPAFGKLGFWVVYREDPTPPQDRNLALWK